MCIRPAKQPDSGEFSAGKNPTASSVVIKRVVFSDASATDSDAVQASVSGGGSIASWGTMRGIQMLLRKRARRLPENPCEWEVEEIYDLPTPGDDPAPENASNDRWAVAININPVSYEREVQHDLAGDMLVNSAGDPILGMTVELDYEEWVIEFTTDTPDWSGIKAARGELGRGCVNSEGVTLTINGSARVADVGTLHWRAPSHGIAQDASGAVYSRETYRLWYREEGWHRKIADMGLNILEEVEVDGTLTMQKTAIVEWEPVYKNDHVTIEDWLPHPVTQPQYLDGEGGTLSIGDSTFTLPDGDGVAGGGGFVIFEEYDIGSLLTGIGT